MNKGRDISNFALEYLDWCKINKPAKTLQETERVDWAREFFFSDAWKEKPIDGVDIAIILGEKI